MNGVLSRISANGFQLSGENGSPWHNVSKYEKPPVSLAGLKKGDSVDYETNNKGYVTKLVRTGEAKSAEQAEPDQKQASSSGNSSYSDSKDQRIARESVLKVAMAGPLNLFAAAEGTSVEDALGKSEVLATRLLRFVNTGKFDPEEETK